MLKLHIETSTYLSQTVDSNDGVNKGNYILMFETGD